MKKNLNDFAKFSGIGFQMLAIILIGAWGGNKLDERFGYENPTFLIICTLLAVVLSIYLAIRDILNYTRDEDREK